MTTARVEVLSGLLIATLRDLQVALCRARSDGPQLAARFSAGRTRVVIDECARAIEFSIVAADGTPDFVEFIVIDCDAPETFGHLGSLGVGADSTQH